MKTSAIGHLVHASASVCLHEAPQDVGTAYDSVSPSFLAFRLGRGFAQRACAARRSASLRSSGLTFRHRAAPRPTAVRRIGEGESFRLAMSSSSVAKSSRTSGGRPVWRMIRRNRAVRLEPRTRASSTVRSPPDCAGVFSLAMRVLVVIEGVDTPYHCRGRFVMSADSITSFVRRTGTAVLAVLLCLPAVAFAQSPRDGTSGDRACADLRKKPDERVRTTTRGTALRIASIPRRKQCRQSRAWRQPRQT